MSDNFEQSQRNTIWKNKFGDSNLGKDIFGSHVTKGNFEVDHIYPKAKGGLTVITNGMPLHPNNNAAKGDNLKGIINGKRFQVQGKPSAGKMLVNNIPQSNGC